MEWINYREVDDADEEIVGTENGQTAGLGATTIAAAGPDAKGVKAAKDVPYIAAPADAALAGSSCPICQESFETVWHDGAQEWVWMDAESVGGRIYHASCRAEVAKDNGAAQVRQASVLGKRKLSDGESGANKVKREMGM